MRRQRVVDTARELFVEHGFHGTGVAQIARRSGIAVGQIYRDFGCKEDIVAALTRQDAAHALRLDTLKAAIDSSDSEQVTEWLLALLEAENDREGKALFAEILAESARNDRIAAIFKSLQADLRSKILIALVQIAPDSRMEEQRKLLADLLLTFSLGLVYHQLMAPDLRADLLVQAMQTTLRERLTAMAS